MKEDVTGAGQYIQVMIVARILKNFIYGFNFMETGDAKLFEDSKSDAFWGTGKKGNGMNMLGLLLMEERERIRGETQNE